MKKLYIIYLLSTTLIYNCNSQNNHNPKVISSFIENLVKSDIVNVENLMSYMNIHQDSISGNEYNLVKYYLEFFHQTIDKNNYSILSYKELKNKEKFKDYKIQYNNINNVYCIINNDSEYITAIIIDNGRIISFFSGIIKNKNKITPYILNSIN